MMSNGEILWAALAEHGTSKQLASDTGLYIKRVRLLLADWCRCGLATRYTRWYGSHQYTFIYCRADGLADASLEEAERQVNNA